MEGTAAARIITPGIAGQVNDYIQATGTAIAAVAKAINYSRTTVSRYLAGKYDSDPRDIEAKLTSYLQEIKGESAPSPEAPELPVPAEKTGQTPRFFEGRDAKTILGVCQAAQEYHEMGIIVGRSGYGKTYTLKEYAKLPKVAYMECDVAMNSRDLVRELEKALGLRSTPNSNHDYTIHERLNRMVEFLVINPGYLIIVDEADKLMKKYSYGKMDILRAIFDRCSGQGDQSTCGIVIAGEPALEVLVKDHLKQFANRTLLGADLQGLTGAEVEDYLSDYDITPDALAELKVRALNSRTGCFRLLNRTMRNVRRILDQRKDQTITREIIQQASSLMMV